MKHNYDRLTIKYMVIEIILFIALFILSVIMIWLVLIPLLKTKQSLVVFKENLPFFGLLGIFLPLCMTWFVFFILWYENLSKWIDTMKFDSKEKTMLLVAKIMWFLFQPVAWILVFLVNSKTKKSLWEAKENSKQKNKNI